jgi:hypothetical protein
MHPPSNLCASQKLGLAGLVCTQDTYEWQGHLGSVVKSSDVLLHAIWVFFT